MQERDGKNYIIKDIDYAEIFASADGGDGGCYKNKGNYAYSQGTTEFNDAIRKFKGTIPWEDKLMKSLPSSINVLNNSYYSNIIETVDNYMITGINTSASNYVQYVSTNYWFSGGGGSSLFGCGSGNGSGNLIGLGDNQRQSTVAGPGGGGASSVTNVNATAGGGGCLILY